MDEDGLVLPSCPEELREEALSLAHRMIEASKEHEGKFTLDDFEIGKPLGRGKFGRVYMARDKKRHFIVALKTIIKEEIKKSHLHHQVLREIEIQTRLEHPNILRLYTYFHDEKRIFLVLEFAANGELFSELHRQPHSRFSESRAAKYVFQVAAALEYCHSRSVIHRDIKPENILLDINDNIKLADFGWSVHAPSKRRQTMCGTIDYLPPEIVNHTSYNERIDHWTLGILTYELLSGHPPFESSNQELTYEKIRALQITYPVYFSSGSRDLIKSLLKLSSSERIGLEQVKSHPWIKNNYKITN